MRRKHIAIVIIAAVILAAVIVLVETVPVYPAFQKHADSIEDIQNTFRNEAVVYPQLDETDLDIGDTMFWLDGRTVISKTEGYLISAVGYCEDMEIRYSFSGMRGENQPKRFDSSTYQGVAIGVSYGGDMMAPYASYSVALSFSADAWSYELSASGRDKENKQSQQERGVMRDYMQDILLIICQQMIDSKQSH